MSDLIFIGCSGGSGSRIIAHLCGKAGYSMGSSNGSGDAHDYIKLLKQYRELTDRVCFPVLQWPPEFDHLPPNLNEQFHQFWDGRRVRDRWGVKAEMFGMIPYALWWLEQKGVRARVLHWVRDVRSWGSPSHGRMPGTITLGLMRQSIENHCFLADMGDKFLGDRYKRVYTRDLTKGNLFPALMQVAEFIGLNMSTGDLEKIYQDKNRPEIPEDVQVIEGHFQTAIRRLAS